MVMKPLKKSALREIRKNRGRYFAILAIIALGVGFFCGLRICRTAMVQAGDGYVRENNLFDYRLISTLGFTQEDQDYFAALDGVNCAEGAVWTDFLCAGTDGNNRALRAHSITESVNRLHLTAGRMPEADNEAVADARYFTPEDIGSEIVLSDENDGDTLEKFRYRSYTIVGLANSVYYMNYERGNTSLGSGTLSAFVYMPYGGFDLDYFTEIFVDIDAEGEIYSDAYNDALSAFEALLEAETEKRADLRYRSLVEDAQAEVDDAQAEVDDARTELEEKYSEYQQEKRDANAELLDAHAELEDARQQIDKGEAELDRNARKISDAEDEYQSGLRTYRSSKSEFEQKRDEALAQLADAQTQIDQNRAAAESGIQQIEDSGVLDNYRQAKDGISQLQAGIDALESERSAQLGDARAQLEELQSQLSNLDAGISAAEAARDSAAASLQGEVDSLNGQISAWEGELSGLDEADPDQAERAGALRGQISAGQSQIASLKDQISAVAQACEAQVAELTAQRGQLQAAIDAASTQISAAEAAFDAQRAELDAQLDALQSSLRQIEDSGALAQYEQAQAALSALDAAQAELDEKSAAAQAELDGYQAQLDAASAKLSSAKRQIESGKAQLEDGRAELESARQDLQTGLADYESALVDAETQFMDAEQEFSDAQLEIDDAQLEIDDAQEKIGEIEPASLYALSRKTNVGYACFENDSQIVHGISTVFPLFFFLVAALVCMTTMTRMVDEQRTEIGTLKALGYSKAAIMSKYLFYSGSAALAGTLIGFFGGSYLFPKVIWMAYDIMYGFAEIPYMLDLQMGALALCAALACSMGATWLSCNVELNNVPAQLIRPKAPKAGKRVLLERIGFIWRRLSFLRKVTMRNVFRYKKRFLMMVIGIGGCTALLVTGFGINDSIANLANDQFGRIMLYDLSVSFSEDQGAAAQAAFTAELGDASAGVHFVHEGAADIAYGDQTKQINLIASEGTLSGFIDLHCGEEAIPFPDAGACVISRNLSERCGLNVGDRVTVYSDQMERMELTISGVFDNYIYNYLITSMDSITAQWGDSYGFNAALVNCAEGTDPHNLSARISDMDGVSNVTVNRDTRERFDNMMSSLNYIVILVVVCAAALAFIVLYNLTNINITERIREIATVKVLGFTLRETASYALSENLLLSALGAAAGLPLGRVLHAFVMAQIKVDLVAFDVRVLPLSYALSVVLTLMFAWLVNLFMLRKIDRINMAESLKTIE